MSEHHHDHHAPHPYQPDIEDAPLTRHMALTEAVAALLLDRGLITADALRRMLEVIDQASPAGGAAVVARAWVDDGFKARLIADANAAAHELGIDAGAIPIRAVANTLRLHNVICCTLCSCYPRYLLGASPAWYKSRAYRSRVVREPRGVLAEFGLILPDDVAVEVHDATAELRYMVIPVRPAGTEGWDEAHLATLVTRDCLIGTALPRVETLG